MRSSKPSKRAESSVSRSSPASSSTTAGQRPPLRRQRDDPVVGHAAVDGVERGRDDVDAQHHAGPAAVRLVVDLTGAQRRGVAVVEEPQIELVAEHGGDGRCSVSHAKACGTRVKTSSCTGSRG